MSVAIPPRPEMSMLKLPGWRTLVGIGVFVGVFIGIITTARARHGNITQPMMVLIFVAALSPSWLGAYLDERARRNQLAAVLDAHGFVRTEDKLCDPDVDEACDVMRPWRLKPRSRRFLAAGNINGRDVWIARHTVGAGKHKQHLTSCAVRTDRAWTPAIVRRRNLLDKLANRHDLGHAAFDQQREIRGDDPARAATDLAPLVDWFVTDDHQPFSFKIREIPGKREQWAFHGNWVVLAEMGRTGADGMVRMCEFMAAFADAADARAQA